MYYNSGTYCSNYSSILNDNDNHNDEETIKKRKELTVRGLTGLKNQGNSCYLNSIIQCLSNLDLFRSWLIKDYFKNKLYHNSVTILSAKKRKKENISDDITIRLSKTELDNVIENTIVYRLAEVFKEMWKQNCTITPKSLKDIIGEYSIIFKGYSQNDSQEVLNLLLDKTHEETKSEVDIYF